MMKKQLFFFSFLFFLGIAEAADKNGQPGPAAAEGRIFVVNIPLNDLSAFEKLVRQAAVLKPYGKVQVSVSTLADKSWHEIPAQGSSWHEYASANPTPYKFFPHKDLAPFVPADFVKKNRQLLMDKIRILRKYDMEAAFLGYEPNFLPLAFFEAHPEMMGPRVDHPRRSTEKAFAPCINVAATREMYASMLAEMLKQAPEITSFTFKTNDAGAGICWAEWLYSGANGPTHCKGMSMGDRVKLLLETFQEGAKRAGRPLAVYLDDGASNFSEEERRDIEVKLPANCYFKSRADRQLIQMGGTLASLYPVTGIINPVSLIDRANQVNEATQSTVFIGFRAAYDRGTEPLYMTEFILQTLAAQLKQKPFKGAVEAGQRLAESCRQWAGEADAVLLQETLQRLNEAMDYKAATFPRVHSLYWGVTMRLINRPLVLAPQLLKPEEEAYFLPMIFNTSPGEARMDYMDLHGGRASVQTAVVENYVSRIRRVSSSLLQLKAAGPEADLFRKMATGLLIHASIMRSCANFSAAQAIRDKNRELVYASPAGKVAGKEFDWSGHPDYIPFNNIMRDELDNTAELISLLEKGGAEQVIVTKDPRYEDHFILGPELLKQLYLKRTIMLRHWQDVQLYFHSPLK